MTTGAIGTQRDILITVRNRQHLAPVLETLQSIKASQVLLQLTGSDDTEYLVRYQESKVEQSSALVKLRVQAEPSPLAGLEDRYEVWVSEIYASALGEEEAVRDWQRFYEGMPQADGSEGEPGLAQDPIAAALLAEGFTLTHWGDLDRSDQERFMDHVQLFAEGPEWLSPELMEGSTSRADALERYAPFLQAPHD